MFFGFLRRPPHRARLAQWHDVDVGFFDTFVNHDGRHTWRDWYMRHGKHSGTMRVLASLTLGQSQGLPHTGTAGTNSTMQMLA